MSKAKTLSQDSVQSAIATIRATADALRDAIAEKTRQRNQLREQIAQLQSLPICFDDWLVQLKEWIGARAKPPSGNILAISSLDQQYVKPFNQRPWSDQGKIDYFFHGTRDPSAEKDLFGALCFYLPDVVFTKLAEHYRATAGQHWGNDEYPRVQERVAMIERLEKRIAVLNTDLQELQAQLAPLLSVGTPNKEEDDALIGGAIELN